VNQELAGIGASDGIAIGPGWVYRPIEVEVDRVGIDDPHEEITRLDNALAEAKGQLRNIKERTLESIGAEEAAIFEAHEMFLDDPEFLRSIKELISEQSINSEAAVLEVVERFANDMLALEDEYFQTRAQDIRDVGRRIIHCLAGIDSTSIDFPNEPVIILADDLTPSDTVQFDREMILGLCTVRGGPTSHTAILARSIGVPAAVNVPMSLDQIKLGNTLILDGTRGVLTIEPSQSSLARAETERAAWQSEWQVQLTAADRPAITLDGKMVEIVANVGNAEDAKQALKYGAEGIGLLRTEFLYLDRQSMPDEGQQIDAYQKIFDLMDDRPLVVRTLDIGGDKAVSYLGLKEEPNPFLGWRAIRMINERPEVLRDQLRALLRVGVGRDLRIMIPLVSSVTEVQEASQIFEDARRSLIDDRLPFQDKVQFGIMVEVPSAALLVEQIADYVDFFSIGTNDLTQYTLAVDRTNERVANLASPFHPAVIKLIARTIRAAHKKGKWVGLCGEMAGDPLAAPLLLGFGLDEFSMAPTSIPKVKQMICKLDSEKCAQLANDTLGFKSTQEVVHHLHKFAQSISS
jgi:phosphoenolpyruvate-protein phosphotransferase